MSDRPDDADVGHPASSDGPAPLSAGQRRDLASAAARGGALSLAGQLTRTLGTIVSVAVLARLLSPADFGLVAIVVVVVGAGEVIRDLGLTIAAVQAAVLTPAQKSNLFWINAVIGLLMAAALFAAAGPLADLYGQEQLAPIARTLAFVFVINGLAAQFRAQLQRSLAFRYLTISDLSSFSCGVAAALGLAAAGAGYWAIVAQQLAQASVFGVMVAMGARWRPGHYRRHTPLRSLLRFGGANAGVQVLDYLSRSIGSAAIGFSSGVAAAGIYDRASQVVRLPLNQIAAPATQVALPILSRLQGDRPTFLAFLQRGQAVLVIVIGLVLSNIAIFADVLVGLILGSAWDAAVPIVRILAIGGLFQVLSYITYWVFLAFGLGGSLVRWSLLARPVLIATTVAGSLYGAEGAATGYSIGMGMLWIGCFPWAARASGLHLAVLFRRAFISLLAVTLIVGCAFGVGLLASDPTSAEGLLLRLLGEVVGAAVAVSVFPSLRGDVRDVYGLGRYLRSRRNSAGQ